jgi:hypothetical protein
MRSMGTNGANSDDSPYFETAEPTLINKLLVPKGARLVYTKCIDIREKMSDGNYVTTGAVADTCRAGNQNEIMDVTRLKYIFIPSGETLDWGGIPASLFVVYRESNLLDIGVDYDKLSEVKLAEFKKLMSEVCSWKFEFKLKSMDDFSFNKKNILGVEKCLEGDKKNFMEVGFE